LYLYFPFDFILELYYVPITGVGGGVIEEGGWVTGAGTRYGWKGLNRRVGGMKDGSPPKWL
jgi:hypothetical protein